MKKSELRKIIREEITQIIQHRDNHDMEHLLRRSKMGDIIVFQKEMEDDNGFKIPLNSIWRVVAGEGLQGTTVALVQLKLSTDGSKYEVCQKKAIQVTPKIQ